MKLIKKILLIAVLLTIVAVFSRHYGYKSGYIEGKQITNAWWIDKKSRHYETSDVIRKRMIKKHHFI